jgi:hypothetical protein
VKGAISMLNQTKELYKTQNNFNPNTLAEIKTKHAVLKPNPHILEDLNSHIKLARIDNHEIWLNEDGSFTSSLSVTSLGYAPLLDNDTARSIYIFLDGNEKEIARYDCGIFPCKCGDKEAMRTQSGRVEASVYNNVAYVDYPVPGNWTSC